MYLSVVKSAEKRTVRRGDAPALLAPELRRYWKGARVYCRSEKRAFYEKAPIIYLKKIVSFFFFNFWKICDFAYSFCLSRLHSQLRLLLFFWLFLCKFSYSLLQTLFGCLLPTCCFSSSSLLLYEVAVICYCFFYILLLHFEEFEDLVEE